MEHILPKIDINILLVKLCACTQEPVIMCHVKWQERCRSVARRCNRTDNSQLQDLAHKHTNYGIGYS